MQISNFPDLIVDARIFNTIYDKSNGNEESFIKGVEDRMLDKLRLREKIPGEHHLVYDNLNSYYRMIVHRVARYYGLKHEVNVEGLFGEILIIRNEDWQERPILKMQDFFEPRKQELDTTATATSSSSSSLRIMKREVKKLECIEDPLDDFKSLTEIITLEERERKYVEARARIFVSDQEDGDGDEDEKFPFTNDDLLLFLPNLTNKASVIVEDVSDEEKILLKPTKMWNNVDGIKEFIPVKTENTGTLKIDFNYSKVEVPSHIKVITIPKGHLFKNIKSIIKKNNCRIFRSSIITDNALLFLRSEDLVPSIENILQIPLYPWIPKYFEE